MNLSQNLLTGKRALITGLASERSIAYGIASVFHALGAEIALTYQNDKLKRRAEKFAKDFATEIILPCDVSSDEEIQQMTNALGNKWDSFDILVHSVAFAPADQLASEYHQAVTREGFRIAHDVSSYSFAALAKAAFPMMQSRKGALLTLSYIGSERAVPFYNVMGLAKASLEANVRYLAFSLGKYGIRVNAISAGPIHTLAASGISNFEKRLEYNEKITPLRQRVTIEQVGNAAAFLCSDMASAVTGEILHVDNGFHAMAASEEATI